MVFTFFISTSTDQNRVSQNDTFFFMKNLDIKRGNGCFALGSDYKRALD